MIQNDLQEERNQLITKKRETNYAKSASVIWRKLSVLRDLSCE